MNKLNRKIYFALVTLTLVLATSLGLPFGRREADGFAPLNFGGPITYVSYCCNGVAITVGPPRPGRFLITVGTILYAHYNVYIPGPYVLGSAVPGGTCQIPATYCLVPTPVKGIVTMIGSSAL